MGFKTITSLDADTVISLGGYNKKARKENPTSVEGYFLGSKKVNSPKSKDGVCYIHYFQTAKGDIGVWGKTDLDRKLLQALPGAMTRASFDKMVPTPNGEMYRFKVEVDLDNMIEVSTQPEKPYDPVPSDDDYPEEVRAEESEESEDDIQQAALIAAEKRAKVEALLNRNKSKAK